MKTLPTENLFGELSACFCAVEEIEVREIQKSLERMKAWTKVGQQVLYELERRFGKSYDQLT